MQTDSDERLRVVVADRTPAATVTSHAFLPLCEGAGLVATSGQPGPRPVLVARPRPPAPYETSHALLSYPESPRDALGAGRARVVARARCPEDCPAVRPDVP